MVVVLHKVTVTFVVDEERWIVGDITNRIVDGDAVKVICSVEGVGMVIFCDREKATLSKRMNRIVDGDADVYFVDLVDPHPRSASACGYVDALRDDLDDAGVIDACVPWLSLQYPLPQLSKAASV